MANILDANSVEVKSKGLPKFDVASFEKIKKENIKDVVFRNQYNSDSMECYAIVLNSNNTEMECLIYSRKKGIKYPTNKEELFSTDYEIEETKARPAGEIINAAGLVIARWEAGYTAAIKILGQEKE